MQFESFAEFIAMDGHGLYVWLCYGVGLVVLAANLISALSSRKGLIRDLAQKQRREALRRTDASKTESANLNSNNVGDAK